VTWVGWRLQRTETLVAAALLGTLAVFLVPQGFHMASAFASGNLNACTPARTPACGVAVSGFLDRFTFVRDVLNWLRLVPGMIGVVLAAPLVLELENGTYRLAWTQGVTRRRLLAAKLAVAVATALLAAAAFSVLLTWSRGPLDHILGRMESGTFDVEWIVPLAATLFAFGLAFAVGVVTRRTGASLLVAFAAYVGCRILVDNQLRPHYLTPVTRRFALGSAPPSLTRDIVVSEHLVDAAGRRFTVTPQIMGSCSGARGAGPRGVAACLAQHGAAYFRVVYQPAGRFWIFQGIETALLGVLGLALVALAALWLQRAS
jgi:ABC-2 family transporter protein